MYKYEFRNVRGKHGSAYFTTNFEAAKAAFRSIMGWDRLYLIEIFDAGEKQRNQGTGRTWLVFPTEEQRAIFQQEFGKINAGRIPRIIQIDDHLRYARKKSCVC